MIRATNLSLVLGRTKILDDLSFEVGSGEAIALVGANGSGKTSIFRCLLGFVPFSGSLTIGGADVVTDPISARSRVGYLPQRPSFGDASAEEVLHFIARLRRIDKGRVAKAISEMGLGEAVRRPARTYSGGMLQRLSMAAALLADPPVLFLDEPTASLDREGQQVFLEIATRLRSERRTLMIATHRSDEVARLADRVLHIEHGRFIEDRPIKSKGDEGGSVTYMERRP